MTESQRPLPLSVEAHLIAHAALTESLIHLLLDLGYITPLHIDVLNQTAKGSISDTCGKVPQLHQLALGTLESWYQRTLAKMQKGPMN